MGWNYRKSGMIAVADVFGKGMINQVGECFRSSIVRKNK
jgi:hypothetical protein